MSCNTSEWMSFLTYCLGVVGRSAILLRSDLCFISLLLRLRLLHHQVVLSLDLGRHWIELECESLAAQSFVFSCHAAFPARNIPFRNTPMQFAGVQTNFDAPPCALGSGYWAAPLMHFRKLTACVRMRLGLCSSSTS